tara:strand:- start:576 stop:698 length:123 start_codon:yes stop_codon:yes gene_type:complete
VLKRISKRRILSSRIDEGGAGKIDLSGSILLKKKKREPLS